MFTILTADSRHPSSFSVLRLGGQEATSFNNLIGADEQHRRQCEPERLRSLEIDTQLEFGRSVEGISPGLLPLRTLSMRLARRRKVSGRSIE